MARFHNDMSQFLSLLVMVVVGVLTLPALAERKMFTPEWSSCAGHNVNAHIRLERDDLVCEIDTEAFNDSSLIPDRLLGVHGGLWDCPPGTTICRRRIHPSSSDHPVYCSLYITFKANRSNIECFSISLPVVCEAPSSPANGSIIEYPKDAVEGEMIFFQCDQGFLPSGIWNATCVTDQNSGGATWVPNPAEQNCTASGLEQESTTQSPPANLAAFVTVGSVCGLLIVVLIFAAIVFGVCFCYKRIKSDFKNLCMIRHKESDSDEDTAHRGSEGEAEIYQLSYTHSYTSAEVEEIKQLCENKLKQKEQEFESKIQRVQDELERMRKELQELQEWKAKANLVSEKPAHMTSDAGKLDTDLPQDGDRDLRKDTARLRSKVSFSTPIKEKTPSSDHSTCYNANNTTSDSYDQASSTIVAHTTARLRRTMNFPATSRSKIDGDVGSSRDGLPEAAAQPTLAQSGPQATPVLPPHLAQSGPQATPVLPPHLVIPSPTDSPELLHNRTVSETRYQVEKTKKV